MSLLDKLPFQEGARLVPAARSQRSFSYSRRRLYKVFGLTPSGFSVVLGNGQYADPETLGLSIRDIAQAVGVAPPNKEGEAKVDCVVDVVRGLKLPSPGSYAAKVTFSL